jgi:hypothetical protein
MVAAISLHALRIPDAPGKNLVEIKGIDTKRKARQKGKQYSGAKIAW